VYIYTNKPSKVLFALTKLLMTDEVTRIDGILGRHAGGILGDSGQGTALFLLFHSFTMFTLLTPPGY
jgi:hypothetical protein